MLSSIQKIFATFEAPPGGGGRRARVDTGHGARRTIERPAAKARNRFERWCITPGHSWRPAA